MLPDPRDPMPPAWIACPTESHPSKWHLGLHSIPFMDEREHEPHRDCWCQPTQVIATRPTFITAGVPSGDWQHHALDGRPLEPFRQQLLEEALEHGPRVR